MDRRLIYTGQIPADVDYVQNPQFAMIAAGFLTEAAFGSGAWAYGLAGTQTSVPSLTINIGRGALGQMSVVDQTNPGTAPIADSTDALMKTGINLTATALTFVAPTTSGQSQVFLIQGQMSETDGSPQTIQYYNADDPSAPLTGPGGSGAQQNTLRTQRVALSVVAGAPASTGTQTTPAAATGWVPLYTITLSNGQTAITTSQIVQHPAAPFLPWQLSQLAPGFSREVVFRTAGVYSFTVPPGVYRLYLEVVGAGGGGAGSPASGTVYSGGGGGAGGYCSGPIAVTPGQVFTVTVGAAGAAGAPGATAGAGGASSFGSIMTALGGAGATNASSGAGGSAVGGTLNIAGETGADGGNSLATNGLYIGTGRGGSGPWNGTGPASVTNANNSATGPGSGGGGAYSTNNLYGGYGGAGCVIVRY